MSKTAQAKKPNAKTVQKKPVKAAGKPGRPSLYSNEVVDSICSLMISGLSLRKICAMDGMPGIQTVMGWLADPSRDGFRHKYARARDIQADIYAAETVDIADEEATTVKHGEDGGEVEVVFDSAAVARNRLRVDARKWYAAKLAPKKYGDRVEQVHSGSIGVAQVLNEIDGTSSGLPSAR